MRSLTEHELKQIILIKNKILMFEKNKLDLFELICDLGGLLSELESVSEFLKDEFQAEVNALEIIHGSIEDGSISRWKGSYRDDMHNAISKLKKMTFSLLEEYLGQSDLSISESAIEGDFNWLICPKCNDAWESDSLKAMVICPKCDCAFHNPHIDNA